MRLGIDLDGVVANFTAGWMRFYNRDFGTELRVEDSQRWHDLVDLTHFTDINEFWDWSSHLDGHSVFWHLEAFEGAIDALNRLRDIGHDIVIITTKPEFAVDDTHDWIQRHHVPTREIHFTGKKWQIDCHIYLDDGPHVLPALARYRSHRTICRYVRPWNRPLQGVVDVHNFDQFQTVVQDRA